jgi:Holliday junction resolvasome RuvABC endonuclease subunit
MSSKQYLGIDASPLRIGAALITANGSEFVLEWHETITLDDEKWITPADRADAFEDLQERRDMFRPDMIGMEAVFVGANRLGAVRAAMALGQIESICDYLWPDAKQKILTATQWRRLCGIQQGGKAPVMQWSSGVTKDHNMDAPEMQDAADAIAIAYATWKWDIENATE